ncbi:MAG: major capsid protein [Lysobacterales bacterium]
MDIFNANPFSMVELTAAVNKLPTIPTALGDLGLFTVKRIRTKTASFEENEGSIKLIPTSLRGAPLTQRGRDVRKLRSLTAPRIAKADKITASELSDVRALGSETELAQVQTEVARRMSALRGDVSLTWENMRLGAVQGVVKDADGSDLYNLYDTFNVTHSEEVDFDLDNASPLPGALRTKCSEIVRATRRACGNAWDIRRSYVMGLCDDTFWDQLIAHPEVRNTYLNTSEAAEQRGDRHTGMLSFGGIMFMHYPGTDDTTVRVPTGTCKFFPVDMAGDFWQAVFSPGEFLDAIEDAAKEMYALTIRDRDRNAFVDLEVYSYPLFVCTRPAALQRARNT